MAAVSPDFTSQKFSLFTGNTSSQLPHWLSAAASHDDQIVIPWSHFHNLNSKKRKKYATFSFTFPLLKWALLFFARLHVDVSHFTTRNFRWSPTSIAVHSGSTFLFNFLTALLHSFHKHWKFIFSAISGILIKLSLYWEKFFKLKVLSGSTKCFLNSLLLNLSLIKHALSRSKGKLSTSSGRTPK